MASFESPKKAETHSNGLNYQMKFKAPNADIDREILSHPHTLNGVRFRFGYIIREMRYQQANHYAFYFSIRCEAVIRERTWKVPCKMSLTLFTLDDQCDQIVHWAKRDLDYGFSSQAEQYHFSHKDLRIQNLIEQHGSNEIFASIDFTVEPPIGVDCLLPLNATVEIDEQKIAINKELLMAHSDYFKKVVVPHPLNSNHAMQNFLDDDLPNYPLDIENTCAGAQHFKIMYDVLEYSKCKELNEDTLPGVLQLADMFLIPSVRSECVNSMHNKSSKFAFAEKFILLDMIQAEVSKSYLVRSSKKEIGSPSKFLRTIDAVKRMPDTMVKELKATIQKEHGMFE